MTVARASLSSLNRGPSKKRTVLAGNDPILSGAYESIATVIVPTGGTSTVSFTSIPSTYKHLQIRGIVKTTATLGGSTRFTVNSDSGVNYATHILYGNGSSAASVGFPNETKILSGYGNQDTTYFAPQIIDFLDYANTNKNKTVRLLSGDDNNGNGNIALVSGVWFSTSAITRIDMTCQSANFAEYSHFALYGIR